MQKQDQHNQQREQNNSQSEDNKKNDEYYGSSTSSPFNFAAMNNKRDNYTTYNGSNFSLLAYRRVVHSDRGVELINDNQRQMNKVNQLFILHIRLTYFQSRIKKDQQILQIVQMQQNEAKKKIPQAQKLLIRLKKKIKLINQQKQRFKNNYIMSEWDRYQIKQQLIRQYKEIQEDTNVKQWFQKKVSQFYIKYAKQLKFEESKLYQSQSKIERKTNRSLTLIYSQKIQVIENWIDSQKLRRNTIILEKKNCIEQQESEMQKIRKQILSRLEQMKILNLQLKQKLINEQDQNKKAQIEINIWQITNDIKQMQIRYELQLQKYQNGQKIMNRSDLQIQWAQLKNQKWEKKMEKQRERQKTFKQNVRRLQECYYKGRNMREKDFNIEQTRFYQQTVGVVEASLLKVQQYLKKANQLSQKIKLKKEQISSNKQCKQKLKQRLSRLKNLLIKFQYQLPRKKLNQINNPVNNNKYKTRNKAKPQKYENFKELEKPEQPQKYEA